jgi:hypothetical protein
MSDKFEQNKTLDGRVMHHRIKQQVPYPLDSKSECTCAACQGPVGKRNENPDFDPIAYLELSAEKMLEELH